MSLIFWELLLSLLLLFLISFGICYQLSGFWTQLLIANLAIIGLYFCYLYSVGLLFLFNIIINFLLCIALLI